MPAFLWAPQRGAVSVAVTQSIRFVEKHAGSRNGAGENESLRKEVKIPQAKGETERAINGARGFALERVNHAKGYVARFSAVLKEYRNAKEVTKQRLYLEAYQTILPNAKQIYIIDSEQKGLLPLLQLSQPVTKGGGVQ